MKMILVLLVVIRFFKECVAAGSGYSFRGCLYLNPSGAYLPYSMSGIITVGGNYVWITADDLGGISLHSLTPGWSYAITYYYSNANNYASNVIR